MIFVLKNIIRILINTGIGAVLVFVWLKLVNINEIIEVLEHFNFFLLIPAGIFFVLSAILKSLRFKILLLKEVNVPALKLINLTFLSQLLSFTIPLRLGELTKAVYLTADYKIPFGKSFIWVFLDRFLDFWCVLSLSLLFLLITPTNLPQGLTSSLLVAIIVASSLVIAVVLKPEYFKHLVQFLSGLLVIEKLKKLFIKFGLFMIECFELLKGSVQRNSALFVLTVLATFSEALCWYIILGAFIPELPIVKIWLGSMLNALTFLIPAAPGYVGSAEAAGLAVFSYGLGFNAVFVSAATLIFHALSLVLILGTGLWGLYNLKFNLGLVWKRFKK